MTLNTTVEAASDNLLLSPPKRKFQIPLSEFWHYRELLYFFVWRDIKVKYKQTSIGVLWAIIQPLLGSGLFTLLFGKLAKLPNDGLPYPVFFYVSLISWTYFSTTINQAGNSVVSNAALISKIYFPRVMLPATSVFGMLLDLSISTVILFALMGFYEVPFSGQLVFLPLVLVGLIWFAFGAGLLLSALIVRFRDIRHALPFLIQLMMFASPVIYPLSIVPEKYKWLVLLNPLAGIIETSRALVSGNPVIWNHVYWSIGVITLVFVFGLWYFKNTERWFADII